MHPRTRLPTILLAAGAAVLLIAVAIGERMGDRVIGQATEQTLQSVGPVVGQPLAGCQPAGLRPRLEAFAGAFGRRRPAFPRPAGAPNGAPDAPPVAVAAADRGAGPDADAESEHPDLAAEAAPDHKRVADAAPRDVPATLRAQPAEQRPSQPPAVLAPARVPNVLIGSLDMIGTWTAKAR